MVQPRYGYKYAQIRESDGRCYGTQDTSDYFLDRLYVPIEDDTLDYYRKYYWPIPEVVTSFDDFQGKWYTDAAHTNEWVPA